MKGYKQPVLSICIPTWNRWYSLQHTLQSIIDQEEFKSGDVEIVISDNASTDETEIEVKKLCQRYKNIRYFRNKKNIGGNPNINKALSLGSGKYLWLFGSDSLVNKDGFKKIFSIIHYYQPCIIYNTLTFTPKFKKLNGYNDSLNIYHFNSTKDFLLYLCNQYSFDKKSFLFIEHLLTFISCICISKNFYIKAINSIKSSYGLENLNNNYFSQGLICFSNNAESVIIDLNCLITRYKIKKTTYFVNWGMVKDSISFYEYLNTAYRINNIKWLKLSFISFGFWFKYFLLGKLIKILMKIKLYKKVSYLWRKYVLNNLDNTNQFIEQIDEI